MTISYLVSILSRLDIPFTIRKSHHKSNLEVISIVIKEDIIYHGHLHTTEGLITSYRPAEWRVGHFIRSSSVSDSIHRHLETFFLDKVPVSRPIWPQFIPCAPIIIRNNMYLDPPNRRLKDQLALNPQTHLGEHCSQKSNGQLPPATALCPHGESSKRGVRDRLALCLPGLPPW